MKFLGVLGSPRKQGNTHLLISKLLEGAGSRGAETDVIFLNDLDIRECDGCHVCWQGRDCIKKDDMNPLYSRIIQSDVLVLGTPVYWYAPTALMKGFLDRFVYFNCPENRVKIKGKSAVIIVPFEEESPKAADLVVSIFEKSLAYLF